MARTGPKKAPKGMPSKVPGFKSERQRRWMWANAPKAARKWSHKQKTRKTDWRGVRRSARGGWTGSKRSRRLPGK